MTIAFADQGAAFTVNTVTANRQLRPQGTRLAGGRYVVTWQDFSSGSYYVLKGQLFNADGTLSGGEFLIGASSGVNSQHEVVTALISGGFEVSWLNVVPPGLQTHVELFDANGTAVSSDMIVDGGGLQNTSFSSVAGLAGGGSIVTWGHTVTAPPPGGQSYQDVFAQFRDAAGAPVGNAFTVNTTTAGEQQAPDVAVLKDGSIVVAWTDNASFGIRAQHLTAAGAKVGGEISVGAADNANNFNVLVRALAGGGYALSWADPVGGHAFTQTFSVADAKIGATIDLGVGSDLSSTALASGQYVDTWIVSGQVHAQLLSPYGERLGSEFRVDSNSDAKTNTNVFAVDSSHIIVSWGDTPSGQTTQDVFAQTVAVNPVGGSGDDVLYGATGNDTIDGLGGNDTIYVQQGGDDTVSGGDGNDVAYFGAALTSADTFDGGLGLDTLVLQGSYAGLHLAYPGIRNVETIRLLSAADPSFGNASAGSAAYDIVADASLGNLTIDASGLAAGESLHFDGSANMLATIVVKGGAGNDVYTIGSYQETVVEQAGGGIDEIRTSLDYYVLPANVENLTETSNIDSDLEGNGLDNVIAGGGGADDLFGYGGNDVLHGGAGDDFLFGGTGNDILYGEAGDDYVRGEAGNDQLFGGDGDDILRGGAGVDSYDGGTNTGVWNLTSGYGDRVSFFDRDATQGAVADLRTGIISNDGYGNVETMTNIQSLGLGTAYADTFYGNDGINFLLGATGDSLYGFGGDDRLQVDGAAALVDGGAGTDTLELISGGGFYILNPAGSGPAVAAPAMTTGWTVDLAAGTVRDGYGNTGTVTGIENVTGSDLGDTIGGDGGANVLAGGAGDDVLDGRAGADTMSGGTGNDIYYVDDANDVVIENAGEGTDEVRTSLASYTLAANVENLTYTGAAGATLRGNALDNVITGGPGADTFQLWDGGHDHAVGGGGYDIFTFGAAYDPGDIVEGGDGIDEVHIQGAYGTVRLGSNLSGIESVGFYGHAYAEGNPGATPYNYNVVIDGITSETNFIYVAGALAANETITIDGSAVGYTRLGIEGGDGNDTLIGGTLDDWISGGAGADVMKGGAGGDTYIVDNVGDVIIEKPGEGIDTVSVSLSSYTLPDNVENIFGFNIDQRLTGNALDNMIMGFGGNDIIDGGAGADTMYGGEGDDIYYVDDAGDSVIENAGEGTDEVRTTLAAYTLTANVEKLTGLLATGQALTGNGLDNVLTGGGGNDVLNGGAGADTMAGGKGNDIYYVDDAGDTVTELAGEGVDEVRTTLAAYTLGANVEKLTGLLATGQSLTGNGLDNVIKGGAGADTMSGGKGNDIYYVDNPGDVVIENSGEGYDEVRTTIANYVLPANVEKLTYIGTGDFNYTGGAGNDDVGGAGGNDYFDLSQGGADLVSGGGGDDAVYFGAAFGAGDKVDGGAGNDAVGLRGDYTGANKLTIAGGQMVGVETLSFLTAAGAAVGYDVAWQDGNLAAGQEMKIFAGGLQAGENVTFDGSAEAHGYFLMYGGLGTDNLKGGAGSDGFYFGPGRFSQADHVDGGGGGQNQLGLDGSYDFSATSALGTLGGNFANIQTIALFRGDPRDTVNPYPNVYHIVTNDAAVAAGKLLTIFGTPVVSSLVFDGSAETDGAFRIFSGTGDDVLTGGQGNDTLYGNLGADTLTGGGGNDTFLYTDAAQSTAAKTDHITDFDAGDKIDLSQIDADSTQAGDQAFAFIGSDVFSHHAGELRAEFDQAHNVWTVQGDIDGDGVADFTLLVTTLNGHQMVGSDFVL